MIMEKSKRCFLCRFRTINQVSYCYKYFYSIKQVQCQGNGEIGVIGRYAHQNFHGAPEFVTDFVIHQHHVTLESIVR